MFRKNGYTRDMERIKQQWKRMKFAAKQKISKTESKKDTDSDTPTIQPTEVDLRIKSLCPDLTSSPTPSTPHPIFKRKIRRLTLFEMEQVKINKIKVEQELRQQEELHEEMMFQLQIDRKRKEVELDTALLKKQKIILEISMLKND